MLPHAHPGKGALAGRRSPPPGRSLRGLRNRLQPRVHALAATSLALSIPLALYFTSSHDSFYVAGDSTAEAQNDGDELRRVAASRQSISEPGRYRFRRPPPLRTDGRTGRSGRSHDDFIRRLLRTMRGGEDMSVESRLSPHTRRAGSASSLRYKVSHEDDEADLNIIPVAPSQVEKTADLEDSDVDREIDSAPVASGGTVSKQGGLAQGTEALQSARSPVSVELGGDGADVDEGPSSQLGADRNDVAVEEEELVDEMVAKKQQELPGPEMSAQSSDNTDDFGLHVHSSLPQDAVSHAVAAVETVRVKLSAGRGKKSPHPLANAEPAARVVYDVVHETKGQSLMMCPCHAAHASWARPLVSELQRKRPSFKFYCVDHNPNRLAAAERAKLAGDHPSKTGAAAVFQRVDFWERDAALPAVDVVLAFGGIEAVPAGRFYAFLTGLRGLTGARDVLAGHFPHVARDDPAHAAWIASLRQQHLHTRNIHNLLRPPFMFPTPKRAFPGLDPTLPQKELLWFQSANVVNRFS